MEEEFDRSELESSDPSDLAFEQALAAQQAEAEKEIRRNAGMELEDDDEEDEEDDNPNDDAPGESDLEDDSDVVEANTPTDDEDDVVVPPQESRKKKPVEKQAGSDEDDVDVANLSRKQRGKIIEEYRQELMKSEEERKRLESQLAAQQQEDAALTEEVNRALGTDAEYEKAVEDGLAGDSEAAERARVWKANRAFYRKLVKSAGKTYQEEFAKHYWDVVKELPGLDMDIVANKDLSTIIQHVHAAGMSQAEAKYKAEIEKLQEAVQTWKGRAKSSGPKAASVARRSPITGGGESTSPKEFNWQAVYLDKQGLPTDEFESLVQRYGYNDVISGKYYKRGK